MEGSPLLSQPGTDVATTGHRIRINEGSPGGTFHHRSSFPRHDGSAIVNANPDGPLDSVSKNILLRCSLRTAPRWRVLSASLRVKNEETQASKAAGSPLRALVRGVDVLEKKCHDPGIELGRVRRWHFAKGPSSTSHSSRMLVELGRSMSCGGVIRLLRMSHLSTSADVAAFPVIVCNNLIAPVTPIMSTCKSVRCGYRCRHAITLTI
ncbi:hypothetical protein IW261DRAFT_1521530 [Armillaria novae-zelandiae]|uniref:Uncharacterized protein n=1 Tax=Armillaria novae-zelandiae TaxID=153914 RepID=A0AA39T5V4_9AGAR|nr:hypothetical protein IW261DRAFT_1521530 [Armillaria novae-zelandiae]